MRIPPSASPPVCAMLKAAAPSIQAKFVAEVQADEMIRAQKQIAIDNADELRREIAALTLQIEMCKKEERDSGPYRQESRSFDENGLETITYVETGQVAALEALRLEKRNDLKLLLKQKWPKSSSVAICTALEGRRVKLVPWDGEIDIQVERAALSGAYDSKFTETVSADKRLKETTDAPLTLEEAISGAHAQIDALAASGAPGTDGFARGSHTNHRGELILGPLPTADFMWPTIALGIGGITPPATLPISAFFFCDQMKARIAQHMTKTWSHGDRAISLAAKRELIPKLDADLWRRRRELEHLYVLCRDAGIKKNRPRSTPVEIILGAARFDERKRPLNNADLGFDDDDNHRGH